jgi:nitroreductase
VKEMDVKEAIEKRRAYRAIDPIDVTDNLIEELSRSAQLMCSCFNKQPWRYVFVDSKNQLDRLKSESINEGNAWAKDTSLIIAVFSEKSLDCVIKDREYYSFDTGMATGAMLLKIVEMGLVGHPIAGFSPKKAREILEIPENYSLITLIIVGKQNLDIASKLNDDQQKTELNRPKRLALEKFSFRNKFVLEESIGKPK